MATLGHSVSPETRAKIAATLTGRTLSAGHVAKLRGRKQSAEHVEKRTAGQRRWPTVCTIEGCDRKHDARGMCSTHYRRWRLYGDPLYLSPRSGSDAANWRGDEVGYDAVHLRCRNVLPRQCAVCGTVEGRLEVALVRGGPPENLRVDPDHGPFSTATGDYVRLCVRCHRRYDNPNGSTRAPIEEALATR